MIGVIKDQNRLDKQNERLSVKYLFEMPAGEGARDVVVEVDRGSARIQGIRVPG